MPLWVKKYNQAHGNSWASAQNLWVKTGRSPSTNLWKKVQKVWVKTGSYWVQAWPKSGPYTTTAPYFSTDTAGNNQPSGFSLNVNQTYYLQKGTWLANGGTISSYSSKIYKTYNNVAGSGGYTLTSGPTSLTNYTSITLTDSIYDGYYVIGDITATRSDNVVGIDSTDSNGYRYFVMRKYPPTQAAYTPTITYSYNNTTSAVTLLYTNKWNGTSDYLPDSTRSNILWYTSTNGSYTSVDQITANANYVATSTPSIANNGTLYTASASLTLNPATIGNYYYAVEYEYNSNSDWSTNSNSTPAPSAYAVYGPISGSPDTPTFAYDYGQDYATYGNTAYYGSITVTAKKATSITATIYRSGNSSWSPAPVTPYETAYSVGTNKLVYSIPSDGYYYMTVIATNSYGSTSGNSITVNPIEFFTGFAIGTAYQSVSASTTALQINLSWTPATWQTFPPYTGDNITYRNNNATYEVYRSTSSSTPSYSTAATYSYPGTGSTNQSDTAGLSQNTKYYYWIRGNNNDAHGAWVSMGNATTGAVPTISSSPTFTLLSGTANTVGSTYRLSFGSWNGSPTSYQFQIYYNDAGGTSIYSSNGTYSTVNSSTTYYDYTFTASKSNGTGGFYSIGADIYAINNFGTSNVAQPSNIAMHPDDPVVNSYPTISGTGAAGSNITYAAGSYSNGTIKRTDLIASISTTFSSLTITKVTSTLNLSSTVNTSALPGNGSLQYTVVVSDTTGIYASPNGTGTITYVSGGYITAGSYVTAINGNTLTLNQHTGYTVNNTQSVQTLTFTNSSYTVLNSDSSSPSFVFAIRDTVLGDNGTTYYYYSGGYSSTGSNTVTIPNGLGSILSYTPTFTINSYPTISGSGVYGNTVTGASGSYSYGTLQSSTLIYLFNTSSTNSYTGTTSSYGSLSHTWSTSDPAGNPTHVATRDTVLGLDNVTYYVFSGGTYTSNSATTTSITDGAGAIKSLYATIITAPTYPTGISSSGGWSAVVNNTPNPSGGSYAYTSATVGSGSIQSNGTITASGLGSQQSSTVYGTYSVPGYTPVNISATGTSSRVIVTPTITMAANSGVTSTSGTINWTSTNQSSYSSTGTFSGTGTTATSISKTGLAASTTYTGTVTVTSSTGDTAYANYSLTTAAASVAPSGGSVSISPTTSVYVGTLMTGTVTNASGNPTPTFSSQWQVNSGGAGGQTYMNAVGSGSRTNSYTVGPYDPGYSIREQVTFTNGISPDQVANSNPVAVTVPSISSIYGLGNGKDLGMSFTVNCTGANNGSVQATIYYSTSSSGGTVTAATTVTANCNSTGVATFTTGNHTGTVNNYYYIIAQPYAGARTGVSPYTPTGNPGIQVTSSPRLIDTAASTRVY